MNELERIFLNYRKDRRIDVKTKIYQRKVDF